MWQLEDAHLVTGWMIISLQHVGILKVYELFATQYRRNDVVVASWKTWRNLKVVMMKTVKEVLAANQRDTLTKEGDNRRQWPRWYSDGVKFAKSIGNVVVIR